MVSASDMAHSREQDGLRGGPSTSKEDMMFSQSDGLTNALIKQRQAEVQQGLERHQFAWEVRVPRPATLQPATPPLRRVRAWLRMATQGRTA